MKNEANRTQTVTDAERNSAIIPSLWVIATAPDGSAHQAPVGIHPTVIGAGADCDLMIPDERVSRRHCELVVTERGILLRDLGSKNSTFVGDIQIITAYVPLDAPITIGASRLTVRLAGAPTVVELSPRTQFGGAIGTSVGMRGLFAKLERVAPTNETILLIGESGTGKEILAAGIHEASSRREGPFTVFDCSTASTELIASHLFGHERGAFTGAVCKQAGVFESAQGGTLFIDEIGELPLNLQPKLLRALQEKEICPVGSTTWKKIDVRVIAATNRNLSTLVSNRSFREDLYYRLAVLEFRVPPLRERKCEIPLLVQRFLKELDPPRGLEALPPKALDLLSAYDWPGNVRELRNVVARTVLLGPDELSLFAMTHRGGSARQKSGIEALFKEKLSTARDIVVSDFERAYLKKALERHHGNVARAATSMGVTRQHVYRMIERLELGAPDRQAMDGELSWPAPQGEEHIEI